jgi:4-alpha-glucanotransferase
VDKKTGLVVPIFSLEGKYGVGDIASMYRFIDQLHGLRVNLIQTLPLNVLGGTETSPYSSISAFANHPLYISLDHLKYLPERPEPLPVQERVDYQGAMKLKYAAFKSAWLNFSVSATKSERRSFSDFCRKQAEWLRPYAVFHALFASFNQAFWDFPEELQSLSGAQEWAKEHEDEVQFFEYLQWVFYEQWQELRAYAAKAGIIFMGDLPLYVSRNSADYWQRPEMFKKGVHAGVPPDLYAEEGQDWGNPIYDWELLEKEDFAWWKKRMLWLKEFFDVVRIDHFRGLYSYWEVVDGQKPNTTKDWTKGPGTPYIEAIRSTGIELVGEDLGFIPPEVEKWIESVNIVGYRPVIFGWGNYAGEDDYGAGKYKFPEEYGEMTMACSSTHDSESLLEFLRDLSEKQRFEMAAWLGIKAGESFTDELLREKIIQKLLSCKSRYVVFPLQDITGQAVRINLPGTVSENNWTAVIPVTDKGLQELQRFLGK